MKKILTSSLAIAFLIGTMLFSNNIIRNIKSNFSIKQKSIKQSNLILKHSKSLEANNSLIANNSHASHDSHDSHESHYSSSIS